jgi:hypothetical protein
MSRFDLGHLNLTGGVVWELWDGRYETFMSENSPYTCDMEHQFDKFAIHSPVLFLSLIMR